RVRHNSCRPRPRSFLARRGSRTEDDAPRLIHERHRVLVVVARDADRRLARAVARVDALDRGPVARLRPDRVAGPGHTPDSVATDPDCPLTPRLEVVAYD